MLFHILNVLYFYIRNFPKYVCSAKHGCFLQFLDFMLFRYVGRVFSERFWDGSCCVHEESACNSWLLKMGSIGRAETSVTNYQSTLRNIQDEWQLRCITSQKGEDLRNEI